MSETLIECQGLSKRYGSQLALDNVSLSLSTGEPIALIGPNGAGKTTLISLICGFIGKSSGQISVLGGKPGAQSLSGQLAALPQDALLDPRLSVGRQLRFFARLQGMNRREARADVQRVLETVDLLESINTKPSDLSHGMRKRIAIAQALLGAPRLVLLDEPTAGIDPPNAKLIRDLIRQQSRDTTFIVSSHNLDELERLCNSVVYLEKGRLISSGPLVVEDNDQGFITLRLATVPEDEFLEAAAKLPGIRQASRSAQGDYLIQADDDMHGSLVLMQLLSDKGWRYRQISRGKSLEERLYGNS
ncbi:ABC transporter ATP-binding protein [Granulosicoccus antarcticus]|uniref:Putative ABC transporter ATP-binding protein YxlF n=1 Tax=Granulosicoccus antarcticus IMCC3135 TaxID=1192854 RepID=A0A2Z2NV65_9GAMM|nr:ABC transporter ATP-binding protein [Granulosicoccus antarcticus]ASJ75366.1 putative ABC transporter ATP-binding protein YxlF [Granulosicoccus antarcticus IMCC3135]